MCCGICHINSFPTEYSCRKLELLFVAYHCMILICCFLSSDFKSQYISDLSKNIIKKLLSIQLFEFIEIELIICTSLLTAAEPQKDGSMKTDFEDNYLLITCGILSTINLFILVYITEIILWMRPANERRRYIVTSALIGWAHLQNNPCIMVGFHYLTQWWPSFI